MLTSTNPQPRPVTAYRSRRHVVEGLAVGLIGITVTTVPKWAFSAAIGRPSPFILYFLPILLAAYRGGWVAGVATTTAAAVAASVFLLAELAEPWVEALPRLALFVGEALAFVYMAERFTRERHLSRQLITELFGTRDRLNTILECTADGITVRDAGGAFQFANDGAARIMGFDSARDLAKVRPGDVWPQFNYLRADGTPYDLGQLPSARALATHTSVEDIIGVQDASSPDAPVRWVQARAKAVFSSSGKVDFLVTSFYAITQSRARELELALAHEWFQIALQSIDDAVLTTNEHGLVNMVNPVAERLLAQPAAALHGRSASEVRLLIDESTREPVADAVARVLTSGKPYHGSNLTVLRRGDGTELAIDETAAPIRDADGKLRGVILVFRDVSAKRRRERYEAFLTSVTRELNGSLDYRTTLTRVAEQCLPLLGDSCLIQVVQGDKMVTVAAAPAHRTDGRARGTADLPRDLDREVFESRSVVVPLTRGARVLGSLELSLDGSSRTYTSDEYTLALGLAERVANFVDNTRLFEEMKQAREAAVAADRTKSDFLAMLGHELRNPLAPIRTAIELLRLQEGSNAEKLPEFRIIDRQLKHLVRLVDDLLDISRITHGRVELDRKVVEVAELFDRACEMVWPTGSSAVHQVHVDVPPGLRVYGDPVRLAQVVTNLLVNACKYAPPGTNIWLQATERGDDVAITVRDEGMGIEPEMLQRVFDAFVQEPQALDRSRGGLGLGLSIVKGLVDVHGGKVNAHSEGSGKGSVFEVSLPLHRGGAVSAVSPTAGYPSAGYPSAGSPASAVSPSAVSPSAVSQVNAVSPRASVSAPAKRRILVVDDNLDAVLVMAEVLRKLGHTVFTATSPSEALEVAAAQPVDVALLDIGLPQMSGYELAREMRKSRAYPTPAFVAVTGYGQLEDQRRSQQEGFAAHLVKPVELHEITTTLRALPPAAGQPPKETVAALTPYRARS